MKISALPMAPLALLLLVCPASRLQAGGDDPATPKEKKRIVIHSPEKSVVVDGDRVILWNGDDPEMIADLAEAVVLPGFSRHGGRGHIGVQPVEMTPELRQHFGAPKDAGVFVGTVEAGGPAEKAGLQVGDILVLIDGESVGSTRELVRAVRHKKDGEKVKVDVLRDRAAKSFTISVVESKETEIRIGDLEDGMRQFRWKRFDHGFPMVTPVPPVPRVPPVPPAPPGSARFGNLENRIQELEQRLQELESRSPAH